MVGAKLMCDGRDKLHDLRMQINDLDRDIMALLGKRMQIVKQVTDVKIKHDLPAFIPDRIEQVIGNVRQSALDNDVDADLAEKLYRDVIDFAVRYEQSKMDQAKNGQ
jgi:isochorismate pyruvate lyase